MSGYVELTLQQFYSPERSKPQHSSYQWNPPTYGAKIQMVSVPDNSKPLDEGGIKRLKAFLDYSSTTP